MPEATVKQKYEEILRFIRGKGIKVYHRKIRDTFNATYDSDRCFITIDHNIRGTIDGCYSLCHEFAHWQQHRIGEFPEYFKNLIKTEKDLSIVYKAEQDAARKALRMLYFWKIRYAPPELDSRKKKYLMEVYRELHFN